MSMRFSFKTPHQDTDWKSMCEVWRAPDDIDVFDAGWTFDHFYPIYGQPSDGPCFESWTMLSAIAGMTRRLRLGVLVTGNAYRHPALVANMAATLDQISGGRLEIGLGAGWNEEEAAAYGIELGSFRERLDRLEESVQIIDLLLTKSKSDFAGRHYSLRGAYCEPKGIQQPRPPICIGGSAEKRTLRIAARFAEQWNTLAPPKEFARLLGVLKAHCAEVGRDSNEIEPSVQVYFEDTTLMVESIAAYREAGARHIIVALARPYDVRVLEPLADTLAPFLP
jgi:F420-dependent oxidoreductase-like protein